jgi:nucleotide-binding universal stress UspA family protein
MIQLERILVATDFSDHSRVALQYGVELAKAFQAELILFHAVERPDMISQIPPAGEGYFPPNYQEIQEQQAQAECERMIGESGLSSGRIIISTGSPFVEIIRVAREENVDLIIVGTHGRGAIIHLLLGSVAEKVVRKAPCPVLTVRHGEHEFVMP